MGHPDYLPTSGQDWEVVAPIGHLPAPSQPVAAPGWHPDPTGAPLLRYFDGQQWTAHTAPPPPQYDVPPPSSAVAVAVAVANGGGPNHVLHAVLTLVTCGLWLPIWIIVAILGRRGGGTSVSITR
jgi:hypothetical protein